MAVDSATDRDALVTDLTDRLRSIDQSAEAWIEARQIVHDFLGQHGERILAAEHSGSQTPDLIGREMAALIETLIECSLALTMRRLIARRGLPLRPDGTVAEIAVIGLGDLGSQTPGADSPIRLVFLYDSIDHRNIWHQDFYTHVVREIVELLAGDESRPDGLDIDLRDGPRFETGTLICGLFDAVRIFETGGGLTQRMAFAGGRAIAGSQSLGREFLKRLEAWIYPAFRDGAVRAEIEAMRHKLQRRCEEGLDDLSTGDLRGYDLREGAGGRADLVSAIRMLQILHGGNSVMVRTANFYDSISRLRSVAALSADEAATIADLYAKLTTLQQQLARTPSASTRRLPADEAGFAQIAVRLGIVDDNGAGDVVTFKRRIRRTVRTSCETVAALMESLADSRPGAIASEAEWFLDPDPDPDTVGVMMKTFGLTDADTAMEHINTLGNETVPFLSPQRCRHCFSQIAPDLLAQVASTPGPDETLANLVRVTDSLGAKATLWEMFAQHRPTMNLVVRLSAASPYLSQILIDHPGMIDELVDSLRINRMPTAERIDAHSIELCRGAADIGQLLHNFKNGLHLMIGVHDLLRLGELSSTHAAISHTAEACLRRMTAAVFAELATRYGDPVTQTGEVIEPVIVAFGRLGGLETNYHSDLDVLYLYSQDGETRRRPGGRRTTTTHAHFFGELAREVVRRIDRPDTRRRLYEIGSRFSAAHDETVGAMRFDEFFGLFDASTPPPPLWQRLALTKARVVSGARSQRTEIEGRLRNRLQTADFNRPALAAEISTARDRLAHTAHPDNLKRGVGGFIEVELVTQWLLLQNAPENPDLIDSNTIETLRRMTAAGTLPAADGESLRSDYETLRRIESGLRLMDHRARHELPHAPEALRRLAFLLGETDPDAIVSRCRASRKRIRAIYENHFDL